MLHYLFNGFGNLIQTGSILALFIGVFLGIIIGSLPGLTATMGIALLIPFTYGMDPAFALSLMVGIFAGGIYGGSISAILLRTPGTPAAGATVLDGYPLAQKGQAGKALAVSTIASALGGLIGAFILTFLAPQIARIAVLFGPPEYVLLGVYGLSMISYVAGKSMAKGIFMGVLGLLISTIGIDPISGFPRFTFHQLNLLNGLSLLPVLIGLFAAAQAFEGVEKYNEPQAKQAKLSKIGISGKEFLHILPHIVKSAFIGTFVGAVPGTGTDIAAFLSYGEAKRSSKNGDKFGTGMIEGVAAPESGNNACVNGAMIPMFTLGIPGEAATAVMLGGLMLLGLQPGPLLFRDNPQVIYTVFASTITSNLLILVLGLLGARFFAKVLQLPTKLITTMIFVLAIIGSYAMRNNAFDVGVTIIAGFLGFVLTKADYPVPPLLLGLILGPLVEANLGRTVIISEGNFLVFFTRPLCWLFWALILYTVISNLSKSRKASKRLKKEKSNGENA